MAYIEGGVRLVSRNEPGLPDVPGSASTSLQTWASTMMVLDGEIVAFDAGRFPF